MDTLEAFLNADYAGEILIGVGALLVLFGVWRIVSSGFTLALWTLLCAVGVVSVSYGMQRSGVNLPALPGEGTTIAEGLESGRELSTDVLRVLCERFEIGGGG